MLPKRGSVATLSGKYKESSAGRLHVTEFHHVKITVKKGMAFFFFFNLHGSMSTVEYV